MRRVNEISSRKSEVRQKKRKLDYVEYSKFDALEVTLSKYKNVLDSFDFKEFIYDKLSVISNPVGKRVVMGDNFNED